MFLLKLHLYDHMIIHDTSLAIYKAFVNYADLIRYHGLYANRVAYITLVSAEWQSMQYFVK